MGQAEPLVDQLADDRLDVAPEARRGGAVAAADEIDLADVGVGRDLETEVPQPLGDRLRAPTVLEGAGVIARQIELAGHVEADAPEAVLVAEALGERFGLAEVGEDPLELPEREKRESEVEPEVDRLLGLAAALGQARESVQRLLEVRHRLAIRRA